MEEEAGGVVGGFRVFTRFMEEEAGGVVGGSRKASDGV